MSYDWRRTIAYIDQNGNEIERARLRGLLGRPRPEAKIVRTLEARQNDDGGFPSELVQGRPSSVEATALVLGWMQDLSILENAPAQRAVTYLLAAQRPDGSWDESPGLLKYGPPPRFLPGDPRVQALCTAVAAYWLVCLGYHQDHAVARAMAYLRTRQAADGRFLGYLRTTWTAAAVFRTVEGAGSATSARAIDSLGTIEDTRWYPGALTGILGCLADAGVPMSVPAVRRGLARLRTTGLPDGSWLSEDGPFYHVEVTLGALRALLAYGVVSSSGDDEEAGTARG
ncbi:MAG TPA: prenyltransferase/squalene oxidase repeat-containing protein [bacterium]|nr:prenyltransferase/squalene oxidase repeat-containing protein [bacterium]